MTLQFVLTADDVVQASVGPFLPRKKKPLLERISNRRAIEMIVIVVTTFIGSLLLFAAGLAEALLGNPLGLVISALGGFFIVLMSRAFLPTSRRKRAIASFEKTGNQDHTTTLTADAAGFRYELNDVVSEVTWRDVTDWMETDRLVIIGDSRRQWYVVPKQVVGGADSITQWLPAR